MRTHEKEPAEGVYFAEEPAWLMQSCDITDIADTVAGLEPHAERVNPRVREMVVDQCIRDPLTGLFSRRYLEDSLERQCLRADLRHGSLAVAILNLDRFDQFNAQCGHAAGNILRQAAGQLVKSRVRREDIACRYGTEEFAFVMFDASAEVARRRADELRGMIKQLAWCHISTLVAPVTFSAGVAAFPDYAVTPAGLLRAAHSALLQAEVNGRDLVMLARRRTAAAA